MTLILLLAALGLLVGFLSGLLGIGGGIVMAPLLLYIPPYFQLESLSMQTVAGLTVIQGLGGCLSGAIIHRKFRFVSDRLVLFMGTSIFLAALLGGAASVYLPDRMLLMLFGSLAASATVLILLPVNRKRDIEKPDLGRLSFSRLRAVFAASGVGLLGGLVGQGGAFILIPAMTSFVRIPTRIAIGSNLAIVLLSLIAAFIGKALTGQIDWLLALPLALTVLPAARLGGRVSRRVPVARLRWLLAALIALATARIWISVLT